MADLPAGLSCIGWSETRSQLAQHGEEAAERIDAELRAALAG